MPKEKITFELEDGEIVTSGGVIIYKYNDDKKTINLLLLKDDKHIEDIGGCIDEEDKNIYNTISREVYEETNGIIDKKNIKQRIKKADYVYTPRSKYVIFIVHATKTEYNLKQKDFGDIEEHDNIKRKIKWYSLHEFYSDKNMEKVNWRMKNTKLYKKLNEIKERKYSTVLNFINL